jgi:hypothetical protein
MKPQTVSRAALVLAAIVALATIRTATADEPSFRDLASKYSKDGDGKDLAKLVGFGQPVKKLIALQYKIILLHDGKEAAVDPKIYRFKPGDRILVRIEPLSDSYVYIYEVDAGGQGKFLLPEKDENPPLAKAGHPLALPNGGRLHLSEPAGGRYWLLVAAEKPITNRAILARVLSKKRGEEYTPEEDAVRKTLKSTRTRVVKSMAETRKETQEHTVIWRAIGGTHPFGTLTADIRARGVKDGTFEQPTDGGTTALYMSCRSDQAELQLLVSIPFKVVAAEK